MFIYAEKHMLLVRGLSAWSDLRSQPRENKKKKKNGQGADLNSRPPALDSGALPRISPTPQRHEDSHPSVTIE